MSIEQKIARNLLSNRDLTNLRKITTGLLPGEVASIIEGLADTEQAVLFRVLPHRQATEVFEFLPQNVRVNLLESLASEQVATLLNDMAPDDRTSFLEELPGNVVRELLELISPQARQVAQTLLNYPVNSVGRLMTPNFISVKSDWTIQEVLEHIRLHGKASETLNVVYVTDDRGHLIDDIRITDILVAASAQTVQNLMDNRFVSLNVLDQQEDTVAIFRANDRYALPVIDSEDFLLGIVTLDDVLAVVEAEDTEDIQKFGGQEALDVPYNKTPLLTMVQKRAGWLIVLFVSEMLTATAMGYFEDEIAKAVVLALFVPLIISSGGNSGSQAATLIIRAMALKEIQLSDWWKVMQRELLSGLLLGIILGIIGFFRIYLWTLFSPIYGPHWFLVALTVAFSLVGVVLWGTLSGSMLPIALKRLGFDPATSSAPFVATLVDVTGLVIYFSIAFWLMQGKLL